MMKWIEKESKNRCYSDKKVWKYCKNPDFIKFVL